MELIKYALNGDYTSLKHELETKIDIDVDEQDDKNMTALFLASCFNHKKCVKLLLDYKADPEICSIYCDFPLHIASAKGHIDCVKLLLEHGADPDVYDENGETPLFAALRRNRGNCVKLLLDHSADIDVVNMDDITPLMFAYKIKFNDGIKLLKQKEQDEFMNNKKKIRKNGPSLLFQRNMLKLIKHCQNNDDYYKKK